MPDVLLFSGWGFAADSLRPVQEALAACGIHAECIGLDAFAQPHNLPRCAWFGWSLGGQLALAHAAECQPKTLMTFGSNLSFTQRADWPWGMPLDTFNAFAEGFAQAPAATLKRFTMLCSQGDANARALARQLQSLLREADDPLLAQGLLDLASIDNRPALAAYQSPQRHWLAADDGLVAADCLSAFAEHAERIDNASHAWPISHPQLLAERIAAFMGRNA